MNECRFCGHEGLIHKEVQYIYRHNNQMMVVNNVPCEEGEYCSERYFKADVLKKIETMFADIQSTRKKPNKEISVPVEEFAESDQRSS